MSKRPRGAATVLPWYETVSECAKLIDVMLSEAKHLAFSGGYESRDSSAEFILSASKGLRMTFRHSLCRERRVCSFGEGREIFVTELRQGIIQRALGHSQMETHFGKLNADGFRVQDRHTHFAF